MCFKAENFENLQKSLISWYWSGFRANSGLDLVRIGTKKWSVFGPILINLGPIWQVVALRGGGSEFFTFFPISIILQLFCNITFIRNVYISNFSQFRSRRGVLENQNFPKFKIVHIILGGVGVKKMDFFHNLWHFMFGWLPLLKMLNLGQMMAGWSIWPSQWLFLYRQIMADWDCSQSKIGCQIWNWLVARIPGYN